MICIIIIIFIICCLLCYYIRNRYYNYRVCVEPYTQERAPDCEFPFRNIKDENNKNLNVIAITAPFRSNSHKKLFYKYKKQGFPILGVCSYQEFPNLIPNPYEDPYYAKHNDDYINEVIGWCHCFRPNSTLLKSIEHTPNILISESDFINTNIIEYKTVPKIYDFIYVCIEDNEKCQKGWQSYIRQWELAKQCFDTICDKPLNGIIIGRDKCQWTLNNKECNLNIKMLPFQPYNDFHKLIQQSKILFVPNISDASPRVITEAMVFNVPVLVNENIIGGWKYIHTHTGEFFNGTKEDFYNKFMYMMDHIHTYNPRKYILHNNEITLKQFTSFLKQIYPSLIECTSARFNI